ncbi:adenylate/guanylate cyclase domain-containing protein [Flavobacterium cellulosilyticum]|uniref:Adenylate cyclase n=1 Tax=Flavobacterium cellulosilyticum TaxID=2541731 RepID=A0A4R5C909_9FLAO|nr:adenylate/guanylate cyclase domain-containing protein [Flavobacterium cellulosilyticum]
MPLLKTLCFKKAYILLGFFIFCYNGIYCQNQKLADSIEIIYLKESYNQKDKLKILKQLSVNETDTDKKLTYSLELIQTAKTLDSVDYLFSGYLEKGNALRLKSDLNQALESYFQGARIAVKKKQKRDLGLIYISIATVYSIIGNHKNSVQYFKGATKILRQEKDSINIASALLNAGDECINMDDLKSALEFTKESEAIFNAIKYPLGQAYSLGNLGMIYAKMGIDSQAEKNINKAILLLQKLGEFYPICVYLTYMSDIYLNKNDKIEALNYASRSLVLAKKYKLKKEVCDANLKISELYEALGNPSKSLSYFKEHITYRDSVSNIDYVQKMADLRTDFEVSQKQVEVDLLNQTKKTQRIISIASIMALFLVFLLALGLYRRYKFIKKTNIIIEEEKNKSNNLLLNILPEETALELKQSGKVQAKKFESVTVLFTDFVGFTHYAENLSPEKLVESVDYYFSKFDEIIENHELEKIKTVGDAYMCAGGLPFPTKDHAYKMILAAIDIAEFVKDSKKNNPENQIRFDIRIGINTGPVVAGVVGIKKFSYDIWGDTVNIASRMETNSDSGKINISENTYQLIKDLFNCDYRGEIDAKNKGRMKMYFVNGFKIKSI